MFTFNVEPSKDEWTTKIDALAARLGVEPEPEGGRCDGQVRYLRHSVANAP